MIYIGFIRQQGPARQIHHTEGSQAMTYSDVVFSYGAIPGESELRAIDSVREVYGIRSVQFNAKQRTVRVEYDASRLSQKAVARLLRQAGIDVREAVALA
jgi:copper chaperone CopZ